MSALISSAELSRASELEGRKVRGREHYIPTDEISSVG